MLDSREIDGALKQAGFQLDQQSVRALHHRHNKTNQGIDFIHFLEIAADIALVGLVIFWYWIYGPHLTIGIIIFLVTSGI